MKNLIITFLLVFAFTFTTKAKQSNLIDSNVVACTNVTLSCGISGTVCGATFADLMRNIAWAENHFCGGGPQQ